MYVKHKQSDVINIHMFVGDKPNYSKYVHILYEYMMKEIIVYTVYSLLCGNTIYTHIIHLN